MSNRYKEVSNWYILGVWTRQRVHDAVGKGWITPEEYLELTGEEYIE